MTGKKLAVLVFFIFSFVLFSGLANALRVGVAPGSQTLGTVEPGKQVKLNFYVVSDTKEDLPISLKYQASSKTLKRSDKVNFSKVSEEDFRSWFDFLGEKTFIIPPSKSFYPEAGLYANKKQTVILNIPEDAEPGYHAASLKLSPKISRPKGKGMGANLVTTAAGRVLFRVPGKVVRSGEILNFLGKRIDERREVVKVFFHNTGTVTMSAKLKSLKLFNETGSIILKKNGVTKKFKPDEIGTVYTRIPVQDLKEGKEYKVSATVSYGSEKASKNGTILVKEYKKEVIKPTGEKTKGILIWPILLIIGIVIIYYLIKR